MYKVADTVLFLLHVISAKMFHVAAFPADSLAVLVHTRCRHHVLRAERHGERCAGASARQLLLHTQRKVSNCRTFCCCYRVPHGSASQVAALVLPLAGATLYLVARTESHLQEVSERCKEQGALGVHTFALDMMDPKAISHLAEELGTVLHLLSSHVAVVSFSILPLCPDVNQ